MKINRAWAARNGLDYDAAYATGKPIRVPDDAGAGVGIRPGNRSGTMNRTEGNYAAWLLAEQAAGRICGWAFEPETFLLAPDMRYTPDFRVERPGEPVQYIDVKGRHTWEDAIIKGKAAGVIRPEYRFFLARWVGPGLDRAGGYRAGYWRHTPLGVER